MKSHIEQEPALQPRRVGLPHTKYYVGTSALYRYASVIGLTIPDHVAAYVKFKNFKFCSLAGCRIETITLERYYVKSYRHKHLSGTVIMYCTQDCKCSLCRELRDYNPSKDFNSKSAASGRPNENFILKRRQEPPPYGDVVQEATGHKVIIYFGDSIGSRKVNDKGNQLLVQQKKDYFHAKRLCDEIESQGSQTNEIRNESDIGADFQQDLKPVTEELPSFIESVKDGVINIRIEGTYEHAKSLVKSLADKESVYSDIESQNESFDWSFVQEWRAR